MRGPSHWGSLHRLGGGLWRLRRPRVPNCRSLIQRRHRGDQARWHWRPPQQEHHRWANPLWDRWPSSIHFARRRLRLYQRQYWRGTIGLDCSVQSTHYVSYSRCFQVGESRVKVTGAKGLAPTPTYKICSTYLDGFRGTCAAVIAGGRAAPKGRKVSEF